MTISTISAVAMVVAAGVIGSEGSTPDQAEREAAPEITTPSEYQETEVTDMTTNNETQATETTTLTGKAGKARKAKPAKEPRAPKAKPARAPKAEKAPKPAKEPKVRKAKPAQALAAADDATAAPAPAKLRGGADNGFPFLSKKQIVAKAAEDRGFAVQCVLIMDGRQTQDERDVRTTKYRNRCGWMSSDAHRGTSLASKLTDGVALTGDEEALLVSFPQKYRKQLAAHFRDSALAENPELADKAAVFGL